MRPNNQQSGDEQSRNQIEDTPMTAPEAAAKRDVEEAEAKAEQADQKAEAAQEVAEQEAERVHEELRQEIVELEETLAATVEGLRQVNTNVEAVIDEASGCSRDGGLANTALTEHGYEALQFRDGEDQPSTE